MEEGVRTNPETLIFFGCSVLQIKAFAVIVLLTPEFFRLFLAQGFPRNSLR
jgi:hypothetical protein